MQWLTNIAYAASTCIEDWGYSIRVCRDVYRIYTCTRALAHLPILDTGSRGLGHGVRPSARLTGDSDHPGPYQDGNLHGPP